MLSMILYLASRYFSLPEPNAPACACQQSRCFVFLLFALILDFGFPLTQDSHPVAV